MLLEVKFEKPSHSWAVLYVFDKYYNYLKQNFNNQINYIDPTQFNDRFQGGVNSAQIMSIKNPLNGKYLIISYWDKVDDFFLESNGWDVKNCVEIITSSGVGENIVTPFSYLTYTTDFEQYSKSAKELRNKNKCELIFRGYLYGKRLELKNEGKLKILSEKISPNKSYFEDLTDNKICLSLNGAGEICNRDIEILSAKSVLFRPKLKQKFHNELIPNFHYISFDEDANPKIQSEIILNKFYEIRNNVSLLEFVANNGYEWYKNNGTINANFELLKNIINIEKLL